MEPSLDKKSQSKQEQIADSDQPIRDQTETYDEHTTLRAGEGEGMKNRDNG